MQQADAGQVHPLWKLFNQIFALAGFIIIFCLMAFGGIIVLRDLFIGQWFAFTFKLLGLLTTVVLITVQISHYNQHNPEINDNNEIERLTGIEQTSPQEESQPGTYREIFIRHSAVMALYTPFYLLGIGSLQGLFLIPAAVAMETNSRIAGHITILIMFGFLMLMISGGYWLAHRVVNRPTNQDEDMNTLQILRGLGGILTGIVGMMILNTILFFLPMVAVLVILTALGVHPMITQLAMLLTLIGTGALGWRIYTKYMERRIEALVVESAGEDSKEHQQYLQTREHKSTDERASSMMIYAMFGIMALVGISLALAAFLLSESDLSEGAREGIASAIVLIVGVGGMFGSFWIIGKIAARGSIAATQADADTADEALRRGDYDTVLAISDGLIEELPHYERIIPGAAMHLMAGNIDRAEELIMESITQVNEKYKENKAGLKPVMAIHLQMLGNIYIYSGRYDRARVTIEKALSLEKKSDILHVNMAELELYSNGSTEKANQHLDEALRLRPRRDSLISMTSYYALRAWAAARLGRKQQADDFMLKAFEEADKNHTVMMGELYYLGGRVAQAQGKRTAAQVSFNRVLKRDPNGLYARLAREALDEL